MLCGTHKNKQDDFFHQQPRNMYGHPLFENNEGKELNKKQLKKDLSLEKKQNDKAMKELTKNGSLKDKVIDTATNKLVGNKIDHVNKVNHIATKVGLPHVNGNVVEEKEKRAVLGVVKDTLHTVAGKIGLHHHSDGKKKSGESHEQNRFSQNDYYNHSAGKQSPQSPNNQTQEKRNLIGGVKDKLTGIAGKFGLHHHSDGKKIQNPGSQDMHMLGFVKHKMTDNFAGLMRRNPHTGEPEKIEHNYQQSYMTPNYEQKYLGNNYLQQHVSHHQHMENYYEQPIPHQEVKKNIVQKLEQKIIGHSQEKNVMGHNQEQKIMGHNQEQMYMGQHHEQNETTDHTQEKKNLLGMAKNALHSIAGKVGIHHHSEEKNLSGERDQKDRHEQIDYSNHSKGTESPNNHTQEKKNLIGIAKEAIHTIAGKVGLHHHTDKNLGDSEEKNRSHQNDHNTHSTGASSSKNQYGSQHHDNLYHGSDLSRQQQNTWGHQSYQSNYQHNLPSQIQTSYVQYQGLNHNLPSQIQTSHYDLQGINHSFNQPSQIQSSQNHQIRNDHLSVIDHSHTDYQSKTNSKINYHYQQGLYDQFNREQNHHMNDYQFVGGDRQ